MSEAQEYAELLATKWWTAKEFMRHGVRCLEGPFTHVETERINNAIRGYRETQNLGQDEVEDIILSARKDVEFWGHVARLVPPRRVRSVYDHVRQTHHPFRRPGKWTELDDARLKDFADEGLKWRRVGELMERPADECRSRYNQRHKNKGTQHEGKWSPEEETRLNSIIQDMNESGRRPETTPKFWKEVSRRMDHTRTAKQCSNKWAMQLKIPRWREADSRLLVRKIALLNVDTEREIRWDDLIDEEWHMWTNEKLEQKWAALRNEVYTLNATHRDVVQQLTGRFSTPGRK